MSIVARLRSWTRATLWRPHLENGMDAEFRFHMEVYVEDLVRNGMPLQEAMRQARLEFGGIETHKDEIRESLGLRLWDEFWSDLRFGWRMLRKSPAFAAVAIASMALGIGANTMIFTVTKQVILDKLAVPHAEQLRLFSWVAGKNAVVHSLWGDFYPAPGGQVGSTSFSYPAYQELQRQNKAMGDLFAFKHLSRLTATIDGRAEVVTGELVSGNYYQELEVTGVQGRPIVPTDDSGAGMGPVAVISDAFWTRSFGRSPEAIGKMIQLNLASITIVGINPPGFTGATSVQETPDVFLPFSMQPILLPKRQGSLLTDSNYWWVQIMGRLKPGSSQESARVALDLALDHAVRTTMVVGKDAGMPHLGLEQGSRGLNHAAQEFAQPIYVLTAVVGFVLLLACANLANLLLARATVRQREMSIRLALGAGSARILRQVLTESLLLAILSGIAGFLLGYLGRTAIPRLLSTSWQPTPFNSPFDWRVFAFTAAVSLFSGLLFGLAPAWQAIRTNVNSGLKETSQTSTVRRRGFTGKAIVVFQVSLSVLLVAGAGLFIRTLINLGSTSPGFSPQGILLFAIEPTKSRYPAPKDIALHAQLEEQLASVPGVESVALSSEPLLAHSMSNDSFIPDDQPKHPEKKQSAYTNVVGEHFLTTMGIPLLYGRGFGPHDTATAPKVAIINRQLAKEFYSGANPIGRSFNTGDEHFQIIGICEDARYTDLRHDPPATFYMLYRQQKDTEGSMTYEIRTTANPASLVSALRHAVQSVDKDLPLIDMRTQVEQIEATMAQERIFAALTGGFGLLALVLACIGIYGIMAYTVAHRTNEFGVRTALGAQSAQVLAMVLREGFLLVSIGIFTGLAAAMLLTRYLRTMLYGLKPTDPPTLILTALLLLGTALAASWGPARKASRVDPMTALRHE
ncbi:MAG TPA: ABC transporter permease [Candidatus Angelobacter sp.]|nr:ABC transporter permease [Candidatus Angelobacter sp.]